MGPAFLHGIRFRLFVASLVLLAIPALAVQFISRMETFLRGAQEQDIAVTARAVASALSDRPALFPPGGAAPADPEDEERRRIVGLFAAADPEAAASLGAAYAPLGGDRALPRRSWDGAPRACGWSTRVRECAGSRARFASRPPARCRGAAARIARG